MIRSWAYRPLCSCLWTAPSPEEPFSKRFSATGFRDLALFLLPWARLGCAIVQFGLQVIPVLGGRSCRSPRNSCLRVRSRRVRRYRSSLCPIVRFAIRVCPRDRGNGFPRRRVGQRRLHVSGFARSSRTQPCRHTRLRTLSARTLVRDTFGVSIEDCGRCPRRGPGSNSVRQISIRQCFRSAKLPFGEESLGRRIA